MRLKEIFTPGTLQVPKSQTALKELESVHKVSAIDIFIGRYLTPFRTEVNLLAN